MKSDGIQRTIRTVFENEIKALRATLSVSKDGLAQAISLIRDSRGKVITMGIGKSGLIARKVAATFSSTGTPAVFVHPVECLHGDMGMISTRDVALVFSKSGESDEIRNLVMFLRNRKIRIIAVTERIKSYLGMKSDVIIPFSVPEEACPMGIVPMASTTAQLVLGDALAAVLIELNDFQLKDFAVFHPAGSIGKQLLLKVQDLMRDGEEAPVVDSGTSMKEALVVMTSKAMGALLVVDRENKLTGIITDGDLRRALQVSGNILELRVDDLMTCDPICCHPSDKALNALHLMEKRASQINVLPVIDDSGRAVGILRLHDLVIAGI